MNRFSFLKKRSRERNKRALGVRAAHRKAFFETLESRRPLAVFTDTAVTFNSGILTISDTATAGKNDSIVLSYENSNLKIEDLSGSAINSAIGTGSGTSAVLIPTTDLSALTELRVQMGNGDDALEMKSTFSAFTNKLTITGGSGKDSVVAGAALNLTNALQIDVETIDLRNAITATAISGTASELTVNVPAKIQSAVALAGPTNVINVLTGSYAEAVDLGSHGQLVLSNGDVTIGSLAGSFSTSVQLKNYTLTVGNSSNTTFGGELAGFLGGLRKVGTGTLTLTGDNTFEGPTTIALGALQIGDGFASGRLGTGDVAVDDTLIFNSPKDLIFGNKIMGTGTVIQAGAKSLTLTGSNTRGGQTYINSGSLNTYDLSITGPLGTSELVFAGGELTYSGTASVTRSHSFTLNSNAIINVVHPTTNVTLDTRIDDKLNSFGITKSGMGTLSLSQSQSFDGPLTVSEGTLNLTSSATVFAPVVVKSDALLIGSGEVFGTLTVEAGGKLSPGNSSASLLKATNVNFQSDSIFKVEINGPSAGIGFDQLRVTTAANLNQNTGNGSQMNVTMASGFTPSAGFVVTVLQVVGTSPISPAGAATKFAGLNEGANITVGNYQYRLSYVGGDGNDITLTLQGQIPTIAAQVTFAGGMLTITDATNTPTNFDLNIMDYNGAYVIKEVGGLLLSTTVGTGNSTSEITIPKSSLPGLSSIFITTFGGDDRIVVDGTTMSFAGQLNISAGSGNDVVEINPTLTSLSGMSIDADTLTLKKSLVTSNLTGTATTVNITGTAKIQQGLAFAAPKALINVAAGTYAETVDIGTSTMVLGGNVGISALYGLETSRVELGSNTLTLGDATDSQYDGVITGSTGKLTKTGNGTLTLTGNSLYAGGTTISQGAIQLGLNSSTGMLGTGAVSGAGDLYFNRSDNVLFSNVLNNGNVTQSGSGTLTLLALNSYTGTTILKAGTLRATILDANGSSSSLGKGTDLIFAGGTLSFGGYTSGSTNRAITLNANATIDLRRSTPSVTLDGVVSDGPNTFGLTKTGPGKLILSAANSYNGATTVSAGTLEIPAGDSLASPVTVKNGASLIGNGVISNSVTIENGGQIIPSETTGLNSLSTGALNFQTAGEYRFQIDGAAGGIDYNQLDVTGNVNLNNNSGAGANLIASIKGTFTPSSGYVATLIKNDGVDAISPATPANRFANLPEGAILNVSGLPFRISYVGGDGNDVTLTYSSLFNFSATSGLVTSESGTTATFTVALGVAPTANVTIGLSSSNNAEGMVSPASLTFTPSNWSIPQTVNVTGVNDSIVDGSMVYSIITAPAVSSDPTFSGQDPADVTATNSDNDTANFTITPTSGLTTTEAGGTASFTVALTSQPTANVTLGLTSSNTGEGTVAPASLTFTSANWNVPQTVTVTGVNDGVVDGNVAYTIVTAAATSADVNFNGVNPADVAATNTDDDVVGILVSPTSGLTTTESGGSANFTIKLSSQPAANVTIGLSSSNTAEGTVSPAGVTFTSGNWNVAQTVTVTGVDDGSVDGNVSYSIITAAATSSDASYNGFNAADVSVTNTDNDTVGVVVSPTAGLTTTEAGGTATFTIKLSTQPTASVTIGLNSSNSAEGTASPGSVTFTTANWNVAQTVTITGVDDFVADGNRVYTIVTAVASSADPAYNGFNPNDVSVTNTDNDVAGITVTPTSGLSTTEAGGTASFSIRLNSQPTGNVTIGLSSSNTAEGTVSPASVTFTSANWNITQAVTVTGANDSVVDGNASYNIVTAAASSSDANYNGLNAADVSITNTDNDTIGIVVSPTSGLTTTEAGGTASFTIKLSSQPTGNVTIGLSSSNTSEGTVSPSSVTFTSANWSSPQTITVTGADDFVVDGNVNYTIFTGAATSTDANYNGFNAADVSVTNTDNDAVGVIVSPTSGISTTEAGGTASFTIRLATQPSGSVTIGLSSSNTAEGTVLPSSVTFTTANWNVAQTVTITGVDDASDDGNVAYSIQTAAAASSDPAYNGLNAADVSVTNVDNDTAGFIVLPTSGLTTTEAGGTATFTIRLTSQPTANVSLALSSSNTSEGTVSPSSVTFTAVNWNVNQTVTVTGVDDVIADGNVSFVIQTAAATSTDPLYNGLNPADVTVSNSDNDSASIIITPTAGIHTTEAGGTATFTIRLSTQPSSNVTIGLTSSDTTEGSVSLSSIVFTGSNWNLAQTVTITGVDDAIDDGDVAYSIVTATATSSDANYNGLNAADVLVSNIDNDSAGIILSTTSGLLTTEAGGTAGFTIQLSSQPTANVTIGLTSSNTAEGTVSPTSVTFTSANWNLAQTITISGVDDAIDDGDVTFTIVTAAASSADLNYAGQNAADVSATNSDNDTAGITVLPTNGLITTESGGTATFTIRLNSQPTSDVSIGLSSSNTAEGTTFPANVVFNAANWNVAQTITVTGVDDYTDDGDIAYSMQTSAATSSDPLYNGLNPFDVSVTNSDNDTAGIVVTPTSGLTTSEGGGTASFTIMLASQPTADVTIALNSSDTTEGTIVKTSVTFTPANWNILQSVTVTGVDDFVVDGNIAYSIVTAAAVSTDSSYGGMNAADVAVTNADDETPGIVVNPTSGQTTEAGGISSFTIVLTSQPTANVTIAISSSSTSEGTVSSSSVTFTSANWNQSQTVVVTGVNDDLDDGNVTYTVVTAAAVSSDANYNGLNAADVSYTNIDDDTAGITVSPVSGLVTTEAGGSDQFTIKLNSQPLADVTIAIQSSNTAEGTISRASVVFNASNWNVAQTVTVTGVDDDVDDGNVTYSIVTAAAISSDNLYNGMNAPDVTVSNTDNDTFGVTLSQTTGLTTTEAGGTATFTIRLKSQPTANVSIGLSSSNTAEGAVSPNSVVFTSANWNVPQTITVTGTDDAVDDDDVAFTIHTAPAVSADPLYNDLNAADVSVSNADNDVAGITVTPTSGLTTTEAGGVASFNIVLNSKPTTNVTIGLSSSNTAEGIVAQSSLTFTPANWNVAQIVTVSGGDDDTDDGNVLYSIHTAAAVSGDPKYSGVDAADVSLSNTDNDTVGIIVSPTSGLTTTEFGSTANFTVKLATRPTADVTIALSSSNVGEGSVAPASVTFTAANWNVEQTVTLTGTDDAIDDGDVAYTIQTGPAVSTDPLYNGLNAADVTITNSDDDAAGITVTPTSSLLTTEAGGTATFTLKLNSQPTSDVTIGLSSSNTAEGSVSPGNVTFTASNWNVAQTITITGVDDAVVDGNVAYTIQTAAAISADFTYHGLNAVDVLLNNNDNDVSGIVVTPTSVLVTSEAGTNQTFTIKLNSQPTANVTIGLSSSNTAEGTVSPNSVFFTPTNWNDAQSITVTGVDDAVVDGNVVYSIQTAAAVSADPVYNGVDAVDLSVTNSDNDSAGIIVSQTSGLTTSEAGGTASFTIKLNSQPTANVTIALSSSKIAEGTVSPGSVIFTPTSWNVPQTVTATGVDDAVDDGDVSYIIQTAAASSTDANYNHLDAADISLTNSDNDTAGITVTPTFGLVTTEAGGTANFTIKLNSQPTSNVTIGLSSSNLAEGTVSSSSVTFNTTNWNAAQTITVTGVDDAFADGDVAYSIQTGSAVSADPSYSGANVADVSVTNANNDTAGIIVSPTSGMSTSEALGTATFTIKLSSQPAANVTIDLSSSDKTEGTVGPSSITFTPTNWSTAQTLTVMGVDDSLDDGDIIYTIITSAATSSDLTYNGMDAADVTVTNTDNDTAGITVTTAPSLSTTEAGGTASFSIKLNSQPTADVTISLSSSNTTEGTVTPNILTFSPTNWNTAQTATINGMDDAIDDGDVAYTIFTAAATSTDASYNGMNAADISATNTDNDTAGIIVTPTSGLTTTEAGGTASFTIQLASQPTANVTIGLSSSNTAEGTVSPSSVTFTPTNWNVSQTVTVTGVDDTAVDGPIAFTIRTEAATSSDTVYNNLSVTDVSVTNSDNDVAAIQLSAGSNQAISEKGGPISATISRGTPSSSSVVINLISSDPSVATVPSQVTIVANEISVTFTITVVDNLIIDGPRTVTITATTLGFSDGLLQVNVTDDEAETPWRNPRNPLDVDDDGFVVPFDALVLINKLNADGPGALAPPTQFPFKPHRFFDTNGDGFVSPIDVLLVINYLNRLGGEGESAASLLADLGTVAQTGLEKVLPTTQFAVPKEAVAAKTPRETLFPQFSKVPNKSVSPHDAALQTAPTTWNVTDDEFESLLEVISADRPKRNLGLRRSP